MSSVCECNPVATARDTSDEAAVHPGNKRSEERINTTIQGIPLRIEERIMKPMQWGVHQVRCLLQKVVIHKIRQQDEVDFSVFEFRTAGATAI